MSSSSSRQHRRDSTNRVSGIPGAVHLDIQRLDDVAYLIDLGFKRGINQRWIAFVAISENILTFGSAADVGLHFGVTWTGQASRQADSR